MNRTALGSLLALASWTLACGPGEGAPDRGRVERPAWRVTREFTAPKPRQLSVQETEGETAPWRAQAETILFESPEGPQVLRGPAPRRIVLEALPAFESATHVELTGVFRQPQRLQLHFYLPREEQPLAGPIVEVPASNRMRSVVFDLTEHAVLGRTVERFSVVASGMGMETQVQSLALLYVSPARALPAPGRGAQWLRRSNELRPVHGLPEGVPTELELEVPARSFLEFGLSLGPGDTGLGAPRRVEVEVHGGGIVERSSFELGDAHRTSWEEVRIELEAHAGSLVRVVVRLADGPADAVALTAPRLVVRGEDAPTVLLVTSDTHRADHLGVLLDGLHTPVLDGLAKKGVLHVDCLATANNTNPSHAALFTGRSPRDTGVTQNGMRLLEKAPTLAEAFAKNGFRTWAVVSVDHLSPLSSGLGQGFDRVGVPAGEEPAAAPESVERMLAMLDAEPAGPLFLWLHLFDAHAPYEARGEFLDPAWRGVQAEGSVRVEGWPAWTAGIEDPEYLRAAYRAEVASLDASLGRLMRWPRLEKPCAVVAFTADHGEVLEGTTRPLFDHVGLAPSTLRVPLLLLHGGAEGGSRVERPVRHQDIGRTLLNLAGLELCSFPGTDLRDAWAGPRFALEGGATAACIAEGRFLLDLNLVPRGDRPLHTVRLFDLEVDPFGEADVADRHPEETGRLRAELVRWLVAAPAETWSRPSPAQNRARLAELGYTDGEPRGRLFDERCACPRCSEF